MIKALNKYFFDMEEGEQLGDGKWFYIATFGCGAVAVALKIYTSIF